MKKEEAVLLMENHFRKKVQKDPKIGNAYLLVHSDRLGIHLNIAEGSTRGMPAHAQQPYVTEDNINRYLDGIMMMFKMIDITYTFSSCNK
jgi:hypothetical protein